MSHPIHPMLVHFPIALLFASVLFDLASFLSGWEDFKRAGFWLLILGWIGGLAATLSGVLSEDVAKNAGVPEKAIDRHEFFALTTLALFAILILVRILGRNHGSRKVRWLYMAAAFIGLSFLSVTGYLGGDLVFRYGAGVESKATSVISPQGQARVDGVVSSIEIDPGSIRPF